MFHDMAIFSPLNFIVVPNPKPENPSENTIWVDTDQVTGWYFGSARPEAAQEGALWFPAAVAGAGEFNALKKNTLTVCPLAAHQMTGGAWVRKTAQIYKGGWVDFDRYLYQQGDLCHRLTGGYVRHLITGTNYENPQPPAVAFLDDRIQITTTGSAQALVRTRDRIDLAHTSRLILHIDHLSSSQYRSEIRFFVTKQEITTRNPALSDGVAAVYHLGGDAGAVADAAIEMELDVSAMGESMYVYVLGYSDSKLATHEFCVREIRGV